MPACLHFGVLHFASPDRMFPPNKDVTDSRQVSGRDWWVQRQMEVAMRHLPTDLEVLPPPLLLEQMEREAVQLRSPPASLVAHRDPAEKPTSSSRRKKRQRGAPSCGLAGEEVVSLPTDVRAAASNPASSPGTALSPRLAAAPPMPSSLAPARSSEPTPDELEQCLRFYAQQIKSFRKTSLLYSSPELMEKIKQMEEDHETAHPTLPQPPPHTAEDVVRSSLCHATEDLGDASASAHATEGLGDASASAHATEGLGDASAPAHTTGGLSDQAFQGFTGELVPVLVPEPCDEGFEKEAPPDPVSEGFKEQLVLVLASEPRDEGFKEEAPPDPVSEGFKVQLVLVLVSEGPPDAASASEGSAGTAAASEGSPGHVPEEPVGGLPPRPGPEHLLGFLWGVFMELKPDSWASPGSKPPEFREGFEDEPPLIQVPEFREGFEDEGPLLCSAGLLINLQVPDVAAGRPGLYVSAGLQVFAAVAG
ncbi:hypothetical protein CRENBAI_018492 [Crenichthys baileyi]|uniref:Uncharacterized protein n=1 Tax=Crenichthys baileyi TaxID=28760 RepID=A0AAV9RXD7_9TELE